MAWRKAKGRLSSKAKALVRWRDALKHKSHLDDCSGDGRCKCPPELAGPEDLLARGLRYLKFQGDDPTYIAYLAGWLNPDPPGDGPVKFSAEFLDRLIDDDDDPDPSSLPAKKKEPRGDLW